MLRAWRQDIDTPDLPLPDGPPSQEQIADGGSWVLDWLVRYPLIVGAIIGVWFLRKLWETTPGKILIIGGLAIVIMLAMNVG